MSKFALFCYNGAMSTLYYAGRKGQKHAGAEKSDKILPRRIAKIAKKDLFLRLLRIFAAIFAIGQLSRKGDACPAAQFRLLSTYCPEWKRGFNTC
jgi:hypothetical protein